MRRRSFLGVAAGAAILAAAPGAAQQPDWTKRVTTTPDGGFRMGNPAAKVKLVEYASLTCPHCAHFAQTAMTPLKAKVRSGKVSYEFRNFVLNGVDVTATLLARCAGTSGFFPFAERLFSTQKQWVGKISGLSDAQRAELKGLSEGARLNRLASMGGLAQMAGQYGVTPQRAQQCLSDAAALDRLGAMYDAASKLGVQGTPTFFVNGKKVEADTWDGILPAITKAGG